MPGFLSSSTCGRQSCFDELESLEQEWHDCQKCPFWAYRQNMVWCKGKLDSGIVLIGEAAGREENILGIPFVGKAGQILDAGLAMAKLSYNGVSNCCIINALACRPCNKRDGSNRTPTGKEIKNCRPRLQNLLKMLNPHMVVLMGNTATEAVFGYPAVPSVIRKGSVTFYKTCHPMAIGYNPERKVSWDNFWENLRGIVAIHKTGKIQPKIDWTLPLL